LAVQPLPQFVLALAEVVTLDKGAAANASTTVLGALEARACRDHWRFARALRLDYLLAMMQAELKRLGAFARLPLCGSAEVPANGVRQQDA
jgi:hypothetical protein